MITIKIRSYNFYRAELFGLKPTATDKLIGQRSKLHSHTEFQFSGRYGHVSFSSTMQDDPHGCRFKYIEYSHPERWDTIEFEVTEAEEDLMYKKAQELEGKPYDLMGLLSFGTDFVIVKPSEKGYWCTEACLKVLLQSDRLWHKINLIPDQTHPTMCDTVLRYVAETLVKEVV